MAEPTNNKLKNNLENQFNESVNSAAAQFRRDTQSKKNNPDKKRYEFKIDLDDLAPPPNSTPQQPVNQPKTTPKTSSKAQQPRTTLAPESQNLPLTSVPPPAPPEQQPTPAELENMYAQQEAMNQAQQESQAEQFHHDTQQRKAAQEREQAEADKKRQEEQKKNNGEDPRFALIDKIGDTFLKNPSTAKLGKNNPIRQFEKWRNRMIIIAGAIQAIGWAIVGSLILAFIIVLFYMILNEKWLLAKAAANSGWAAFTTLVKIFWKML